MKKLLLSVIVLGALTGCEPLSDEERCNAFNYQNGANCYINDYSHAPACECDGYEGKKCEKVIIPSDPCDYCTENEECDDSGGVK